MFIDAKPSPNKRVSKIVVLKQRETFCFCSFGFCFELNVYSPTCSKLGSSNQMVKTVCQFVVNLLLYSISNSFAVLLICDSIVKLTYQFQVDFHLSPMRHFSVMVNESLTNELISLYDSVVCLSEIVPGRQRCAKRKCDADVARYHIDVMIYRIQYLIMISYQKSNLMLANFNNF